jgi:DNA-binding transcriptional ArsR family regulator
MEARRDVFQAIADPTRRDILNLLSGSPLHLNAIAEQFDVSRPAVSQHIKLLNECGLISIKKSGRMRYCILEPEKLSTVAEWIEPFRKIWESRFNNLDDLLNKISEKS